jgi:phosphoribosylanthranilate isomerase
VSGFVKICGLTDEAAVSAALDAGADAIGFVFAPSVRRVSVARAHELAQPARGRALCVAVTLHPDAKLVDEILREFAPDVLQTDAADLAGLRLPDGLASWPVIRGDARGERPRGRFLYEGPRSGTGEVADWACARALATAGELILAGGLNPDNVRDGISGVRPFGVDVSSGVEDRPGRKDPARIFAFVERARAAFAWPPTETSP